MNVDKLMVLFSFIIVLAMALMLSQSASAAPGEANVTWTPGQPGTGATVKNYELFVNGVRVATPAAADRAYVYRVGPGVCIKTTDVFTMKTVDSNNDVSVASNSKSIPSQSCAPAAAPQPPGNIQLTIGEASPTAAATVTITWQPVVARTDGSALADVAYVIYRNGAKQTTVKGLKSTQTIKAGSCFDTNVAYSVRAVDNKSVLSAMPASIPLPRKVCSPIIDCIPS